MKPLLQTESSECGLACLAMLASHFGHHADLADLRRQFSISFKGVTLAQLMRHAAALLCRCDTCGYVTLSYRYSRRPWWRHYSACGVGMGYARWAWRFFIYLA